jgi:hypothetical protein
MIYRTSTDVRICDSSSNLPSIKVAPGGSRSLSPDGNSPAKGGHRSMRDGKSQALGIFQFRSRDPEPAHGSERPDLAGTMFSWTSIPGRGRGLVATSEIACGALIDSAPAIAALERQDEVMRQYLFALDRGEAEPVDGTPGGYALVFGPMALCNHADASNARVTFTRRDRSGLEARLTATRAIVRGEEITITYADCDWYRDNARF